MSENLILVNMYFLVDTKNTIVILQEKSYLMNSYLFSVTMVLYNILTLFVSHFSTKIADCVCDLCCTSISLWMCSEK